MRFRGSTRIRLSRPYLLRMRSSFFPFTERDSRAHTSQRRSHAGDRAGRGLAPSKRSRANQAMSAYVISLFRLASMNAPTVCCPSSILAISVVVPWSSAATGSSSARMRLIICVYLNDIRTCARAITTFMGMNWTFERLYLFR